MKALLNIFKHLKSKSWAKAKIVPSWFATLEKTSFSSRFWPSDSKLRYGIFQAWKKFKWVLKLSQWKMHQYEIHSIEVQNLLFTNFNASIYTKKVGNAIKKHALLLRYNNCDYLMPSLSELKVSWTGITARSTEWFISNRSIRLNDF